MIDSEYPLDLTVLTTPAELRAEMEEDVRAGLTGAPKSLPPKYFYDERGSALFDRITRLPEYYLTRAETELLEEHALDIAAAVRPRALIELGSGYSRKTRLLLEAMREHGGRKYIAFDVSKDAIRAAADHLLEDYDWLQIEGVVGDFDRHLGRVERTGPALIAFLGSTLGNKHPADRVPFLRAIRDITLPEDRLLLGVDLVKDRDVLEAAYNDSEGVTAEFNRNVLDVLNRELGADFDTAAFEHRAFYDAENAWIEMQLVAERPLRAHVGDLSLGVEFAPGEGLRTEVSCKFTRQVVEQALSAAGFRLERWLTDARGRFGAALSAPA